MICAALAAMLWQAAPGQPPRLRNGVLEERRAGAGLTSLWGQLLVTHPGAFWIGYGVEGRARECGENCCGAERPIRLEPNGPVAVLYRIEQQRLDRIRTAALDCEVEAGGLPVVWLSGVGAGDSIAHLEGLAGVRGAVAALAMHRDAGALEALLRLARSHAAGRVRGDALFWIAQRAGEKAAPAITEAIEKDPETEVKKRAVFALSQLPKEESVRLLIQVARTNRNPAVRRQAFFWLGQSRDARALEFLEEILFR